LNNYLVYLIMPCAKIVCYLICIWNNPQCIIMSVFQSCTYYFLHKDFILISWPQQELWSVVQIQKNWKSIWTQRTLQFVKETPSQSTALFSRVENTKWNGTTARPIYQAVTLKQEYYIKKGSFIKKTVPIGQYSPLIPSRPMRADGTSARLREIFLFSM